ncbi:MAG: sulfite exporter TauE/SafE family protein [Hydrococcus sp. C42_A2020_068]|uniref:sulfite exporter TauE/SafE family protein n=1 Tax=Pleurocapsa sp. PCC 7327 TaxID=118163 RepID=UPI00029FF314|nr:sulfite exporter TauE/SafE family protein [Pleurocapsa sp. PCC 7327]AFY77077.1 putative permease [Pleurocapsa sp. PCC 7327]MBF2022502.1 sulfite exporter TauE/SafE family protein [Hydrococcus sp. C42_A2020_068]
MSIEALDVLYLFASALAAGALNAITGGGSFVSFPVLVFVGAPTISANATNSAALFPGVLASVTAYRRTIFPIKKRLIVLLVSSVFGGIVGGLLLIHTRETTFRQVIPFLMLFATLLFAFKDEVTRRVRSITTNRITISYSLGIVVLVSLVAIYGGFFGGGLGILLLATLTLAGIEDTKDAVAAGRLLSAAINGISLIPLLLSGLVQPQLALLMALGAILGGYFGAMLVRYLPTRVIRQFVILVGATVTCYFFLNL